MAKQKNKGVSTTAWKEGEEEKWVYSLVLFFFDGSIFQRIFLIDFQGEGGGRAFF